MSDRPYDRSVFVNCPFDRAYRPMLRAIMFAVHDCGFFLLIIDWLKTNPVA